MKHRRTVWVIAGAASLACAPATSRATETGPVALVNAALVDGTGAPPIAVGKRADLVVLEADPTVDIRNVARIERVFLAGREVVR